MIGAMITSALSRSFIFPIPITTVARKLDICEIMNPNDKTIKGDFARLTHFSPNKNLMGWDGYKITNRAK